MNALSFVTADDIRSRFSRAMSEMYRDEVPQYGTLLDLVSDVNSACLQADPALRERLRRSGELDRLSVERHGAIRLGKADELSMMRRIFAVMGMAPVGYYDLSGAGVPVHSTAFRPVDDASLARNPFRIFTSLLRLELIEDASLRAQAERILAERNIFTRGALALTERHAHQGGLTCSEADEFVVEVCETFRWHGEATVSHDVYQRLHDAHRLIADIVCFKGPHINHLTPRTLDIDAAQEEMPRRGITAKESIEGPPRRLHPILLRQTSFKALRENVRFTDEDPTAPGSHTARFGEIEQRGMALTHKGRALYDSLLAEARHADHARLDHAEHLNQAFQAFPDDLHEIHQKGLAFFRYHAPNPDAARRALGDGEFDLPRLIQAGFVQAEPIVYEDFLPVSAAGIFQSNLGGANRRSYAADSAKAAFEAALGAGVLDEIGLYEAAERRSIDVLKQTLCLEEIL